MKKDNSVNMYALFSEELTFQGVKNINSLECLAYLVNGWFRKKT